MIIFSSKYLKFGVKAVEFMKISLLINCEDFTYFSSSWHSVSLHLNAGHYYHIQVYA